MVLLGHDIGALLKRTGRESLDDGVPELAAGAAYNFFLAIFPLLLFLAPLLALVGDKEETMLRLLNSVGTSLPPAAFELFRGVLEDVVFAKGAPGLMSIGAIGALWAGSNVFATLTGALNRAFDTEETRPWWRRRLLAVAAALGTGIVVFAVTALLMGGENLARLIVGDGSARLFAIVQYPAAAIILIAIGWLNFTLLPNVTVAWRHAVAGAALTVVLWLLITLLFRVYVQNFGNYNATYGTIGGVIMLLTWMYLSMVALLAGGELSSELHHGTAALSGTTAAVDARAGRLAPQPPTTPSTERVVRLDPLSDRS